jgi:hypothetical protein
MSRILKRPMFRIGGSTNEGIMSNVVPKRAGYENPQGAANPLDNYQIDTSSDLYKNAIRNAAILSQFAGPSRSQSDRLSDLLIRGGLRTMSERPAGNLFSTIAKAYTPAVDEYLKGQETEDAFQRQLKLAGVTSAIQTEEAKAKYEKEMKIAQMKLEQDKYQSDRDAFIKANADLGGKAFGLFDTIYDLQKSGVPFSKIRVDSDLVATKGGAKIPKPKQELVLTIPEGSTFYDNYSILYKRSKDVPGGYIRLEQSGKEIPSGPAPVKKPTFSESPGAAYDPRAWTKQRFYEELAKKNKPNME